VLQDPLFTQIVAETEASPDLYRPSKFWDYLNSVNTQWLDEFGLENFKRTVSQNYYNWLIVDHEDVQFRAVLKVWLRHPTLSPLLVRMEVPDLLRTASGLEKQFGKRAQLTYRLFVAMLWDVAVRSDRLGLAKGLEEPELGRPIGIWRGKKRISQDLANSIRECNSIARWSDPLDVGHPAVGELGAGYGRVAYALLKNTRVRYFIFDIPPALYVSHWYLSRLFPDRKVVPFQPMATFRDVEATLQTADIAFFTPNQMALFPDGYFDVFLSISSLPEMSFDQIKNYLTLISRVSGGTVYLKQWRRWVNERDGFEFTYDQLVLPDRWILKMDTPDLVQPLFQERAWTRRRGD
jgi:putative sugar O-methyltransferase